MILLWAFPSLGESEWIHYTSRNGTAYGFCRLYWNRFHFRLALVWGFGSEWCLQLYQCAISRATNSNHPSCGFFLPMGHGGRAHRVGGGVVVCGVWCESHPFMKYGSRGRCYGGELHGLQEFSCYLGPSWPLPVRTRLWGGGVWRERDSLRDALNFSTPVLPLADQTKGFTFRTIISFRFTVDVFDFDVLAKLRVEQPEPNPTLTATSPVQYITKRYSAAQHSTALNRTE